MQFKKKLKPINSFQEHRNQEGKQRETVVRIPWDKRKKHKALLHQFLLCVWMVPFHTCVRLKTDIGLHLTLRLDKMQASSCLLSVSLISKACSLYFEREMSVSLNTAGLHLAWSSSDRHLPVTHDGSLESSVRSYLLSKMFSYFFVV